MVSLCQLVGKKPLQKRTFVMKNKSSNEEFSGNHFKIINRKGRMNLREILPLENEIKLLLS